MGCEGCGLWRDVGCEGCGYRVVRMVGGGWWKKSVHVLCGFGIGLGWVGIGLDWIGLGLGWIGLGWFYCDIE